MEKKCAKRLLLRKHLNQIKKGRVILRKEVLTALFRVKTKVIISNPGPITEKKEVSSGNQLLSITHILLRQIPGTRMDR